MRIALVSDAWAPQVNGVVNAIRNLVVQLEGLGHQVLLVTPDQFRSVPCPTYPEIRLAVTGPGRVGRMIDRFAPDAIHLMTEGPLCMAARRHCLRRGLAFTTAYCTNFPEYLEARTGIAARRFWPAFRWFHGPAAATMGSTASVREKLAAHGVSPVVPWGRGVHLDLFRPDVAPPDVFFELPRPIQLYVGRIAVEKNIEAFLRTNHPGTKVVVGAGPALERLMAEFPEVRFLGKQTGEPLAACYAGADVLVFPSRTDTFGVVMIEALACGTPVAAYPVDGPRDVVTPAIGALDTDLERAIARALLCDREACAAAGRTYTWEASARQFVAGLHPARPAKQHRGVPLTA